MTQNNTWRHITTPNIIPLLPEPGFIYPKRSHSPNTRIGLLSSADHVQEVNDALQAALAHESVHGVDYSLSLLFEAVPKVRHEAGQHQSILMSLNELYYHCCQKYHWSSGFSPELAFELMSGLRLARHLYVKVSHIRQVPERELETASSTRLAKAIDNLTVDTVQESPDESWKDQDPETTDRTVQLILSGKPADWPETDSDDSDEPHLGSHTHTGRRLNKVGRKPISYVGWGIPDLDGDNAQYQEQDNSDQDATYTPCSRPQAQKATPRKVASTRKKGSRSVRMRSDGTRMVQSGKGLDRGTDDEDEDQDDAEEGRNGETYDNCVHSQTSQAQSPMRRNPARNARPGIIKAKDKDTRNPSRSHCPSTPVALSSNIRTRSQYKQLRSLLPDEFEIDALLENPIGRTTLKASVQMGRPTRNGHKEFGAAIDEDNESEQEAGSDDPFQSTGNDSEAEANAEQLPVQPLEKSPRTPSPLGHQDTATPQPTDTILDVTRVGRYSLRRRLLPPSQARPAQPASTETVSSEPRRIANIAAASINHQHDKTATPLLRHKAKRKRDSEDDQGLSSNDVGGKKKGKVPGERAQPPRLKRVRLSTPEEKNVGPNPLLTQTTEARERTSSGKTAVSQTAGTLMKGKKDERSQSPYVGSRFVAPVLSTSTHSSETLHHRGNAPINGIPRHAVRMPRELVGHTGDSASSTSTRPPVTVTAAQLAVEYSHDYGLDRTVRLSSHHTVPSGMSNTLVSRHIPRSGIMNEFYPGQSVAQHHTPPNPGSSRGLNTPALHTRHGRHSFDPAVRTATPSGEFQPTNGNPSRPPRVLPDPDIRSTSRLSQLSRDYSSRVQNGPATQIQASHEQPTLAAQRVGVPRHAAQVDGAFGHRGSARRPWTPVPHPNQPHDQSRLLHPREHREEYVERGSARGENPIQFRSQSIEQPAQPRPEQAGHGYGGYQPPEAPRPYMYDPLRESWRLQRQPQRFSVPVQGSFSRAGPQAPPPTPRNTYHTARTSRERQDMSFAQPERSGHGWNSESRHRHHDFRSQQSAISPSISHQRGMPETANMYSPGTLERQSLTDDPVSSSLPHSVGPQYRRHQQASTSMASTNNRVSSSQTIRPNIPNGFPSPSAAMLDGSTQIQQQSRHHFLSSSSVESSSSFTGQRAPPPADAGTMGVSPLAAAVQPSLNRSGSGHQAAESRRGHMTGGGTFWTLNPTLGTVLPDTLTEGSLRNLRPEPQDLTPERPRELALRKGRTDGEGNMEEDDKEGYES